MKHYLVDVSKVISIFWRGLFIVNILCLRFVSGWSTAVYCYHSNGNLSHTIECKEDNAFIHINDAYYGYSDNYTEYDNQSAFCTHNDSHCSTAFERHLCNLSSTCIIPQDLLKVPITESNCSLPNGGSYSNYLYINYTCMTVPDLEPMHICSNASQITTSASIISPQFPGFPQNPEENECFCYLSEEDELSPQGPLTVELKINYLSNLDQLETGCSDGFQIKDYYEGKVLFENCNKSEFNDIYLLSHTPTIQIQYGKGRPKFWISLTASRPLKLSCITGVDESWLVQQVYNITPSTSAPLPSPTPTPKPTSESSPHRSNNLTVGLVIGAAVLSFLLAVMLGAVYFYRKSTDGGGRVRLEEEDTISTATFPEVTARYSCQDDMVSMEKDELYNNEPAVLQLGMSHSLTKSIGI